MTAATRHMARMGEAVVSAAAGDLLVALGLGSCIGLALLDPDAGVAGLVHIVLPQSTATGAGTPAKFADTAVPHLAQLVTRAGARESRMHAVLCGGAHMFSSQTAGNPVMAIGERNAQATLDALAARRISVRAKDVGGTVGRSVEVDVESGAVSVRGVGQQTRRL
jgi:chemotaxis protein CheD